MKKIMALMTILMGFTMSLVLSLVGTLVGGHFSIQSWLLSFGISFVLSLVIGFSVPVKKLGDKFCAKCKTIPESPKGNFLSAVISNLIYTPILTIVMTCTMVGIATKQLPDMAQRINIMVHACIPSLIVCLIVGYVAIVLFQPLFVKLLIGKNGRPVVRASSGENSNQNEQKSE